MTPRTRSFGRRIAPRGTTGFLVRLGCGLLASLCLAGEASAVFTYVPNFLVWQRQVTLRVGTNTAGVIDNVVFDVSGAAAGGGTVASTTGGIYVQVTVRKPSTGNPARAQSLTVDSSAGLACVTGSGCGATVIPFNTISWVSVVQESGTYADWDIPSGTFTGDATQTLYSNNVDPAIVGVMESTNTLTFSYANTTVYPSGNYTGRVVFTAASL